MTRRILDHAPIAIPNSATKERESSHPRTTGFSCVAPEEHPDLAVLNTSSCASVLPRDTDRPGSFLQETGLIHDQNTIRRTQMFDHIVAAQSPGLVLAPQGV